MKVNNQIVTERFCSDLYKNVATWQKQIADPGTSIKRVTKLDGRPKDFLTQFQGISFTLLTAEA